MILLKIYLLTGLIAHKVVWEFLKRATTAATPRIHLHPSVFGRLVKGVKIVILVGIAVQTLLPDVLPLTGDPLVLRIAGSLIYSAGLLIAIRGRTELGGNWSDIEAARVLSEQTVVSNGPYRLIRHPIYVGDLMLLFGLELALNSYLVLGVLLLAPIVLRQAVEEEKKLARALPGYEAYCANTKRFIPFVV
jgi:protein-S-isoprenylcysteine O-methyltransferase Ste14